MTKRNRETEGAKLSVGYSLLFFTTQQIAAQGDLYDLNTREDFDVSSWYTYLVGSESDWHTGKKISYGGDTQTCLQARQNVIKSLTTDTYVRMELKEEYAGDYYGHHIQFSDGSHLVIIAKWVTRDVDIGETIIHEAQHHGGFRDHGKKLNGVPERSIECFRNYTENAWVLEDINEESDDDDDSGNGGGEGNNGGSGGGGGSGEDDENCREAGGQGCEHGTSGGGEENTDDEEEENTGTVTVGDLCVPCAAHPNWPNCCGSEGCE